MIDGDVYCRGLVALVGVPSCVFFLGCGPDGPRWPLLGGTTPDAALSSPYGPRITAGGSYELHRGIDIPTPLDTEVHAIANGRVFKVFSDNQAAEGLRVELCHAADGADVPPTDCTGAAYYGFYAHLSRLDVKVGDATPAGTRLGLSGKGENGFPHLHFEIRTGKGERGSAAQPLTVLPYEDHGAPSVEITSVDEADPTHPVVEVTASVPASELDLSAVGVKVTGAGGKVVSERTFDIAAWNEARTAHGGDAEANTAEIDGLRLTPEHYSQGTSAYVLHVTFLALEGPASNADLRIEATATDALGNSSTITSP